MPEYSQRYCAEPPLKIESDKRTVRVLRPWEYDAIRRASATLDNQTRLDALLVTGMRYIEAQRFQKRPEWFDGTFIHLPKEAILKAKRKQLARGIHLSAKGRAVVHYFFNVKELPDYKAWERNLRRWAVKAGVRPDWLSPKTLRKTWESWLIATFPDRLLQVTLSQGHTTVTALHHYLNLNFTDDNKREMREWVLGWE